MPLGAQLYDLVVKVHADVAAHRDNHGLADLRLVALLEVRHQVGRHARHAGLGPNHLFQGGPARFEAGLCAVFLILGQFVDLSVHQVQIGVVEAHPGQARLVVNRDRGAVLFGLLHVVDMDVVAKHRARVAVFAGDWRAGEGDESGVGQRIAQVLGVADLVALDAVGRWQQLGAVGRRAAVARRQHRTRCARARLESLQLGLETVLGAVRLVGDHHDVAAVGQHREAVLILTRHELLDRGKDNATGRPVGQLGAQVLPGADLHRLLAQQVLRHAEHAEKLAVEVVAIGDHDDGRVLHRALLHHAGREAGHGDALAAALGVPHHAALVRPTGARRADHLRDGGAHRVELVIPGDLFDQRAVVLEQHEVTQVIQQIGRRQHAAHQRLQFVELAQRVQRDAIDGAPGHEALTVC